MAPTPNKFAPDAAEETAVAAGVISSALEAALGSAPEEEAEEQEETEVSPIASPPPPPLHGESACLHHHHSHHGRRPPRRGPDHYHRHAHPPDRPPRGVAEVFDRLVAGVIRPPRMIYEARALGPNPLLVPEQGLVAVRTDFEVTNARGQRLQCSVWKALDPNVSSSSSSTSGSGSGGGWPCVIYLHGNSSSRVEAVKTQVLKAALAGGAGGVAAFDFSGCGLSEGEFLSLGFFEAQDCAAVVDELRRRFGVGPVVLWGRSMGAVSALLYAATGGSLATQQQQRRGRRRGHVRRAHGAGGVRHADPPPAGLILDSPFSSFRRLALDLTTKGLIRMPRLAVAVVLGLLRSSVKRRASFDLYHVNPLAHAHRAVGVGGIPALFLAAEQDELIPPWHGEALEAQWPGPHKLGIRFPGTHNSARPPIAYALASVFVRGAAVRAREYPALAAAMALRLVERTAVVASQEEEAAAAAVGAQGNGEDDEEGAGDGGESGSRRERRRQRREEGRRRRERERRQQSPFQYGEVGAEEGGEGKRKTKTQKLPPAPHFVRAGDGGRGSLASLPGATRALVAALDSSLAARAVEEYLLEELLSVGVALVAADLREGARAEQAQAQAQAQAGKEAVAGTSKKVGSFVVLFECVVVIGSGQVFGVFLKN